MASSQDLSPTCEVTPAHIPIPMPPTNGLDKVLMRRTTLLDNLGIELSTDCYHERLTDLESITLPEDMKRGTGGSQQTYHIALSLQGILELGARISIKKDDSPQNTKMSDILTIPKERGLNMIRTYALTRFGSWPT